MPRIPDAYLDCVIYLYASRPDAEDGTRTGGSGFLVGIPTSGLPRDFFFLYGVTNKHVIDDGYPVIRMNTIDGGIYVFETDDRDWVRHPDGDDLAVCSISFDPTNYKFNFVPRSTFLTKEIITAMKIGPGDDAFLVGRFINHEGKQQNLPTVRFGCIGQMPWEPVRRNGFDQESFLVEARSIGGYSGSPVFVFIPPFSPRDMEEDWFPRNMYEMASGKIFGGLMSHGPWLLGVDWGHILDWEPVRSEDDQPVNPTDPMRMNVHVNTGMMAVVPAWKLADLLDLGPIAEHRRFETEKARNAM